MYHPDGSSVKTGQKFSSMGNRNMYDPSRSPKKPAYDTRDEDTNANQ